MRELLFYDLIKGWFPPSTQTPPPRRSQEAWDNLVQDYVDGAKVARQNVKKHRLQRARAAEPGSEYLRFTSGRVMRPGDEIGGMREDVWRVQIKHTVKKHLEKELQLRGKGVKVLSLFFIDRVANYRDYDGSGR